MAAVADALGDRCRIWLARVEGRPAAAMMVFTGTNAYDFRAAMDESLRGFRANDLLYYAFIRHAAERGCARADFGRSKLGTGAHERKRIWNFEERPLVGALRTADGAEPRAINPLDPKYRLKIALWQKLPLPLANVLGPVIARGLA